MLRTGAIANQEFLILEPLCQLRFPRRLTDPDLRWIRTYQFLFLIQPFPIGLVHYELIKKTLQAFF